MPPSDNASLPQFRSSGQSPYDPEGQFHMNSHLMCPSVSQSVFWFSVCHCLSLFTAGVHCMFVVPAYGAAFEQQKENASIMQRLQMERRMRYAEHQQKVNGEMFLW